MKKYNYKGTFNWFGELHTLYSHAYSRKQAKRHFIKRLATKLVVSKGAVAIHLLKPNSFTIEEEKEE